MQKTKKQQQQQRPISPLRAAKLIQNAIEKRTPLNIKMITGETIENAIPLHIEKYEITFLHEGKILVVWKHAIHSIAFIPPKDS